MRNNLRVLASQLMGIGQIPNSKPACLAWLERMGISSVKAKSAFLFDISDLPEAERRAYLEHNASINGIPLGNYDDEAHMRLLQAPARMRLVADHKAEIARFLLTLDSSVVWSERIAMVQKRFGKSGTSKAVLKTVLKSVKGVEPINFAPALLASYKGRTATAKTTPAAWSFFMTTIRDAGADFPICQAWRDVRDVARAKGWDWPTYETINRRWNALPDAQRLSARFGRDAVLKALAQPAHRDKTTIDALGWVSLDGRTQDFWTDMGDGKPIRITMLALIDVASNYVLGYELAPSENAVDTVRLIRNVCEQHGIFDRLYTDNGSSFAGHLVAGGNVSRFRNKTTMTKGVQPLGICYHLGINIHFALPKNAQAKIAERTFATLSRVIDDRPEFKGAHAGHSAGATPTSDIVPIPFAKVQAVLAREVARHNAEAGRNSQGANGRSYHDVFKASLSTRIERRPTARQLYLASLIYKPVSVNRAGQIIVDQWVYGDPMTQADLLPYHGKGTKILLGRNPDDLSAPAIAFNADGRLICQGIAHVERGAYDSVDGIRTAARNKKAARDATTKADIANNYLTDKEFADALAALDTPSEAPAVPKSKKVVGARFGGPLRETAARSDETDTIPAEFYRNMDTALARKKASGGKLA